MSQNRVLKRKIAASAIAVTMLVSMTMTGCDGVFQRQQTSESSSQSSAVTGNVTSKFGDNIAVKSEHYTMSLPMFKRIFNNSYSSFTQYYASYYGFDTTKSSKLQYYDEDNGVTWYDTFIESAEDEVKQLFVLCEAAYKDGMSLDETDMKVINDNIDDMKAAADTAGQTFEEYISQFGKGLTEKDVRENMEQTSLAQKYYTKLYDSFEYTDEQYEAEYNENKESYQYVDFLMFTFGYGTVDSSDSSVTVDEEQQEKAKKAADELAASKTQDEFKAYITKYLNENPDYVNVSTENSEGSYTEDEFQEAIKSQVESALTEKYAYQATSDAGKWLFDSSRKENDTYIFDGTSSYTVVMMVKPPYRDESINKNVRHILFTADTYGSEANAKKTAEEVYEEWKNGEATEESFAALATQYNAVSDPNSATSGGLYKDVYEGRMVSEFNDWLFDSVRKAGDTDIVKTTYGYHIMYYVGDSMESWKSSVDTVMRRSDYNEKYEELENSITIEFDTEYIYTIPDPTEEEEEEEDSQVSAVVSEGSAAEPDEKESSEPESSVEESIESEANAEDESTAE